MRIVATIAVGAILVALVVAASLALSPGTQDTTPITTDALGMDAQSYAADFGVTIEEARRRLNLQDSVGLLDEGLTANESATFAGLWIQHEPEFRIVTRFTQGGATAVRSYVADGPLDGLVDVRTAAATLNELMTAQDSATAKAKGVGVPVESEIDVVGNRVKLFVVDKARLESSLAASGVQLPDEVDVVTVSELSQKTTNLHAGLTLVPCTAGFAVIHSDGREGISTAAHCEEDVSFNGTDLDFVEGRIGAEYDVEWFEAPTFTLRGLMYDGTNYRVVSNTKSRSQQSVGNYVCKYGKATFYKCGNITTKDFKPDDGDGCNNCTYSATFVRVHDYQNGNDLSLGGDSGGPWFSGNTAYGMMTDKTRDADTEPWDGVYMAINYISGLDVAVKTE